ncbi:HD-GYP domain-containing protein [Psychrobium sp. 1_MG-2023]|uniref:HD-GYP domain-containing protein n=1 Tax=Psychrobium sp. 1_MG-2023 TaxID=3062624 RepID=UPI000C3210F7|nr:HD-GYP domain-containing protein [Psychrobium sp. 1_MG-2023]MDP2562886.1 HD-GYP domain-containing protein [Psychrobium sp. 1_MG-2023]PKF57201.1 phosphohydrolase [Alteromonadales bacterium alter-6D02]
MTIQLDISELAIGMYVVDIAEQTGNFKLAKPGWVKDESTIEYFKNKNIQSLIVDPAKQRVHTNISPEQATPFMQDVAKASQLFNESKAVQQRLLDDAKHGVPIDVGSVESITSDSIETIFENPNALACVLNIRQKDQYLLEHSVSVSILLSMFAKHLGEDKETIKELAIGAFMHDLGKIMIPDEILNKPGKLTNEEFEIMKSHANHSIEIIKKTPGISPLSLEVAALHHEKVNGQGYPNGIGGDDISRYGRMISICDIYDALTANRCYKEGFSQVKAFSILRNLAEENHLDNDLVVSFIKCMGVYPVGSIVKLDSEHLAIVEQSNESDSVRPRVKLFYDIKQKSFEVSKNIDLSVADNEQIVKCVRADDFDLNMKQIFEHLEKEG